MSRSLAPLSAPPSSDWIAEHRKIWDTKASLRAVYLRWFRRVRERCAPRGPVVEIGCGPGFFKRTYPEIVATDVTANPYADRIIDATALPFADGEVGSIVMIDVFHHLPDPSQFLREAARVLRPGGRVVMIEPWLGLAGRLLWTHVHHEECDLAVDPASPWSSTHKDPMLGNIALPFLFFRPAGHLERVGVPLHVARREPFLGLAWWMSGGFQPLSLLPAFLTGTVEALDRVMSLPAFLTATRCLVVLEKAP